MKTCIVGAGALGGLLGARMALAGVEPTLLDRGVQLRALQDEGLRLLRSSGETCETRAYRTAASCAEAGPHDLVLLCLKAYDLPDVADELPALAHDDTVFVTLQNGIPWWYFQRHGGRLADTRLRSVDPDGGLADRVDPRKIIGGVAYPAAEVEEPGVIRHVDGEVFALGELDGETTDRLAAVCDVFETAGLRGRAIRDIRAELWLKELGSVSFNPLSALTGATMAGLCRRAETRSLARRMMEEALAVANGLGVSLRKTIDQRIAGAETVGEHRTSMLQDLEAGRRLELDALVGVVIEIGRLT
ncbi:MAG: ketopantoate reductase family protein, partial [Gemmatimonadota bacterium]